MPVRRQFLSKKNAPAFRAKPGLVKVLDILGMMNELLANHMSADALTQRRVNRKRRLGWLLPALLLGFAWPAHGEKTGKQEADVCVYGGTSAGVVAAVQAAKMGKSVVLIEPGKHLGGMTSGGLGAIDVGNPASIGGLTREYFHRVWRYYQANSAWTREKKRHIRCQEGPLPPSDETMWVVEPHVAEQLFDELAAEAKVTVVRGERLDRKNGARKAGARLSEIRMESGRIFHARMFIDATYEGDLIEAAGVSFIIGREANSQYGETINGSRPAHPIGLVKHAMDPYVRPGDAASGLLPRVHPAPTAPVGSADRGVQAYCYRMCLTDVPENLVPIGKPAGYDEQAYEIVLRAIEAGHPQDRFFKLTLMPNRKTDSNNNGWISTDFVGMSWDYAQADYAARERMAQAHEAWQRGLVWTLQNHSRVPREMQEFFSPWGLPKDEFADSGHWPHQLYIREARRMIGSYVMTESNCRGERPVKDPVGMGSYMMDSHLIQYCVGSNGVLAAEGGMGVHLLRPYSISYGALIPKSGECENLLAPICLSASHAAYGSLRMEPVFMILGESAATAAVLALQAGVPLQKLDYALLRQRLLQDGQRLEWKATTSKAAPPGPAGIEVNLIGAVVSGGWHSSTANVPFVGDYYLHDGNQGKGQKTVRFVPNLPADGRYEVYLYWIKHPNRATNVPIDITYADGTAKLTVDQRSRGGWVKVFTGPFKAGDTGACLISNAGTDGYVVANAARWVVVAK
jgi:hypothetical protein